MDNSIYEVERDEYAGVISQINPETSDVETYYEEYGTVIKVKNKNGIHFTSRIIPVNEEEAEHYYVFNLPQAEDRLPPKAVQKITLKTRDAVQDFFKALAQLQGAKND